MSVCACAVGHGTLGVVGHTTAVLGRLPRAGSTPSTVGVCFRSRSIGAMCMAMHCDLLWTGEIIPSLPCGATSSRCVCGRPGSRLLGPWVGRRAGRLTFGLWVVGHLSALVGSVPCARVMSCHVVSCSPACRVTCAPVGCVLSSLYDCGLCSGLWQQQPFPMPAVWTCFVCRAAAMLPGFY